MVKSKVTNPRNKTQPMKPPARINNLMIPSLCQITINTDGSAIKNGWENASAGIGVWYADGSRWNIALKLENQQNHPTSNSRVELSAILEALRQNEEEDLVIESDSLSSLRAICTDLVRYKDQGWYGIQNTDLLKGILIRLRTRPAQTEFRWVKGHDEEKYGNKRADALADTGRWLAIPEAWPIVPQVNKKKCPFALRHSWQ